jgi:cobalamin biosynthetic protein CobC
MTSANSFSSLKAMDSHINAHGGNLLQACQEYSGDPKEWVDLSTCINPHSYSFSLNADSLHRLPDFCALENLGNLARTTYGAANNVFVTPSAGIQAIINALPYVLPCRHVSIASPTYSEYARAFHNAGWDVVETPEPCPDKGCVVLVHPNNPDGKIWNKDYVDSICHNAEYVIIDESFIDTDSKLSFVSALNSEKIIVLRSLSKFYGLAGVRLGFALTGEEIYTRLKKYFGPWSVSGPAIAAGFAALSDTKWQENTKRILKNQAETLDALIANATNWRKVGGTSLFALYDIGDTGKLSLDWHRFLARNRIWTRVFSFSQSWLRLGMPGSVIAWARLAAALEAAK